MHPNTTALLKIASSIYDMYDHAGYANRHNQNNPRHKERQILAQEESDEGIELKNPSYTLDQTLAPKRQGVNYMSRDIYPGQYNILTDRPNIEGTGHGIPLGRRPYNPQSYT